MPANLLKKVKLLLQLPAKQFVSLIGLISPFPTQELGWIPVRLKNSFKSFSQVHSDNIQKYGGTGLGLAITKRICEMMGGDIFVESKPGEGSTFSVHLPAVMPTPKTATITLPSIPKPGKDSAESVSEPQENIILVIDDDPMIHNQMKRTFEKEGYKIVCASDGEEGLNLARKTSSHIDHPRRIDAWNGRLDCTNKIERRPRGCKYPGFCHLYGR